MNESLLLIAEVAEALELFYAMKTTTFFLTAMTMMTVGCSAFAPSVSQGKKKTCLKMANDEDLMRWAKSSRTASVDDRVVELRRPLGVVLNEDEKTGNVYVETVAPRGNAARTGQVRDNAQEETFVCFLHSWLLEPKVATVVDSRVSLLGIYL